MIIENEHEYFAVRGEFEKAMAHADIEQSRVNWVLDIVDKVVEGQDDAGLLSETSDSGPITITYPNMTTFGKVLIENARKVFKLDDTNPVTVAANNTVAQLVANIQGTDVITVYKMLKTDARAIRDRAEQYAQNLEALRGVESVMKTAKRAVHLLKDANLVAGFATELDNLLEKFQELETEYRQAYDDVDIELDEALGQNWPIDKGGAE